MPETKKLSISLPGQLADEVRALAASQAEGNVSAWLARLAEREVRRQQSLEAVREWEAEHGELTKEELAEARRFWRG